MHKKIGIPVSDVLNMLTPVQGETLCIPAFQALHITVNTWDIQVLNFFI